MNVEYITHMGDDILVVNSARVSFNKESDFDMDGGLEDRDKKLITYLATHGHWTPFSHPQITLRETVPIFVARQRFKHMVGFTYNEVSRRYVDDKPEFFTPSIWRSRPEGSMKQGSGSQRILHLKGDGSCFIEEHYEGFIEYCRDFYMNLLVSGVAPEQARMVLPQSMYTSYYVTGSLAAFARAYKQRADSHAQVEIQELANMWNSIISPLFPVSWEALTK